METDLKAADDVRQAANDAPAQTLTRKFSSPAKTVVHISKSPTAIVYCEGNFAKIDGKTANGLIRHSEAYRIVSVIDSNHGEQDSGLVLDNIQNHIPIFKNLEDAVIHEGMRVSRRQ